MFLTFDVETYGLFGEAFSVGYVLTHSVTGSVVGRELMHGIHSCELSDTDNDKHDHNLEATEEWLEKNVLKNIPSPDCFTTFGIQQAFYNAWCTAKSFAEKQGETLYLVADVAWPCEARFLLQVRHNFPDFIAYPLLDVSSILLARGFDPVATYPRKQSELPAHNPLNDARQSARILHTLLNDKNDARVLLVEIGK